MILLLLRLLSLPLLNTSFFLLFPSSARFSSTVEVKPFCNFTSTECVAKVRRMARETGRFWFGDQWRLNCGSSSNTFAGGGRSRQKAPSATSSLECTNPRELSLYQTLGSRLFRVQTFTEEYLSDLQIFPRIKFPLRSGFYRACDHDFRISWSENDAGRQVEAHPETLPLKPFQTIHIPEISWPELHADDSLVVLMLDVGSGTLKFLATNFPNDTKVIHEYSPIDNVRPKQPTPLVVLVFQPPNGFNGENSLLRWSKDDQQRLFDLSSFIMDNGLEGCLIGLNWFLVGADAFAIERQRLKGGIDNCHTLVHAKLIRDRRWSFVEKFPLNELDASLSVGLIRDEFEGRICCTRFQFDEEAFVADPLGDLQIPSSAFRRKPPQVISFRSFDQSDSYQRSSRHYIAMKEDRFSLVLIDPARSYLYWLVVDVPAEALVTGGAFENEVSAYLPPIPDEPNECLFAVFMLFRQPKSSSLAEFYEESGLRARECNGHCKERARFDNEHFKSFHRLQISAISWARVCYDVYEAIYRVGLLNDAKRTQLQEHPRVQSLELDDVFARNPWLQKASGSSTKARRQLVAGVCERFGLPHVECDVGDDVRAPSLAFQALQKLWPMRKLLAACTGFAILLTFLLCCFVGYLRVRRRKISRKLYTDER